MGEAIWPTSCDDRPVPWMWSTQADVKRQRIASSTETYADILRKNDHEQSRKRGHSQLILHSSKSTRVMQVRVISVSCSFRNPDPSARSRACTQSIVGVKKICLPSLAFVDNKSRPIAVECVEGKRTSFIDKNHPESQDVDACDGLRKTVMWSDSSPSKRSPCIEMRSMDDNRQRNELQLHHVAVHQALHHLQLVVGVVQDLPYDEANLEANDNALGARMDVDSYQQDEGCIISTIKPAGETAEEQHKSACELIRSLLGDEPLLPNVVAITYGDAVIRVGDCGELLCQLVVAHDMILDCTHCHASPPNGGCVVVRARR